MYCLTRGKLRDIQPPKGGGERRGSDWSNSDEGEEIEEIITEEVAEDDAEIRIEGGDRQNRASQEKKDP
jgi:hypothetical protein